MTFRDTEMAARGKIASLEDSLARREETIVELRRMLRAPYEAAVPVPAGPSSAERALVPVLFALGALVVAFAGQIGLVLLAHLVF